MELVGGRQPRGRCRLRARDQREPVLRAHGRSRRALLRRQQQAHGRSVCREHAEAVGRPRRRRGRRTVRSHHHRNRGDAAEDELQAVREQLLGLQPQPRAEERPSRRCARPRRRGPRLHSGRSHHADRLHHDDRRRPHADQPGQPRPEAGAEHLHRRRPRVDDARHTGRPDRVPHRGQGSVHLERRRQQSAAARAHRPVGRNGLDAHISGLELEVDRRFGPRVAVFANTTHYFNRKERLANGQEQDMLNVPAHTVRAGIDVDCGPLSGALSRPLRARSQGQRFQPARVSRSSTTKTSPWSMPR